MFTGKYTYILRVMHEETGHMYISIWCYLCSFLWSSQSDSWPYINISRSSGRDNMCIYKSHLDALCPWPWGYTYGTSLGRLGISYQASPDHENVSQLIFCCLNTCRIYAHEVVLFTANRLVPTVERLSLYFILLLWFNRHRALVDTAIIAIYPSSVTKQSWSIWVNSSRESSPRLMMMTTKVCIFF